MTNKIKHSSLPNQKGIGSGKAWIVFDDQGEPLFIRANVYAMTESEKKKLAKLSAGLNLEVMDLKDILLLELQANNNRLNELLSEMNKKEVN